MTNLKTVVGAAAELGQEVKDSVEEISRSAAKKFADVRDNTGSALHSAASTVRGGSATIHSAGRTAANRLDATGAFVEDITAKNVLAVVRKFGREHAAGFMIAGLALGFVAGSALTRSARSRA